METTPLKNSDWWGHYSLEENQTGRWRIGPSLVWIFRSAVEWHVAYETGDEQVESSFEKEVPYSGTDLPWNAVDGSPEIKSSRISFHQTESDVRFIPLLADRAVIVRPETPLYIPAGERISLFISTPLWLRLSTGRKSTLLTEFPLIRPSDTWFGPNTMEGELCYNTRTRARLRLDEVLQRIHRAITPIRIVNSADDALLLERFRVPVEHLSLYAGPGGFLWTEKITMERAKIESEATIRFEDGAPTQISKAKRVEGPRVTTKTNFITRPFTTLFHKTREA